jgi:hypothetical protein
MPRCKVNPHRLIGSGAETPTTDVPPRRENTNDTRNHASSSRPSPAPASAGRNSPAPASHTGVEAFLTPASSLQIAKDVAEQFGAGKVLYTQTSSLPGSISSPVHVKSSRLHALEVELPSRETLDLILDTYLKAVHWFMLLFHEQTFRRRYEVFLARGVRCKADSNFCKLLLVVCVLGCQYIDKHAASDLGFDVVGFQQMALHHLEANLLSLCEDTDLASVQVCVLLGSFYLYNGRPNLGFVVLGSGIRCAYAFGLHRENSWPRLKEEDIEERRRVWWALFIFDRYASIIYGHPCGIREGEFAVASPRNLDDTTQTHSHGTTMPDLEGGPGSVTLFTYVIFKIELYRLSSPVLMDLYFHPKEGRGDISRTVRDLDSRLCRWRESLPLELRLDVVGERPSSASPTDTTFLLQALALQVAYDNILILLHRPLLLGRAAASRTYGRSQGHAFPAAPLCESLSIIAPRDSTQTSPPMMDKYSRDRCLESASRSAGLCDMKHCLMAAKRTHAVAYLGINLFTAGIVLSTVALSSPLSALAQQAKNGIRKILIISDMFKSESPIAPQTKQILGALVRVILDKELEALTCTESMPPLTSVRASPHRKNSGGQEDELDVDHAAATNATMVGASGQTTDRVADSSSLGDHGAFDKSNDSDFPTNFDIDLVTGINSLQDSE